METESLCQWCARWKKDARGRLGTCQVPRQMKLKLGGHKRGRDTIQQTRVALIATHADDGCGDHFVEKAGVFLPVVVGRPLGSPVVLLTSVLK